MSADSRSTERESPALFWFTAPRFAEGYRLSANQGPHDSFGAQGEEYRRAVRENAAGSHSFFALTEESPVFFCVFLPLLYPSSSFSGADLAFSLIPPLITLFHHKNGPGEAIRLLPGPCS